MTSVCRADCAEPPRALCIYRVDHRHPTGSAEAERGDVAPEGRIRISKASGPPTPKIVGLV